MGLTQQAQPRRASKTVTFTGAAGAGQVGTGTVFTVTGEVLVEKIVPTCTTTVAAGGSGAGTPSIQLGVASATTLFVASTTPANIVSGKFWSSATPTANGVAVPAALKDIAITDDVQFQVTSTQADVLQVDTLNFPTFAGATSGDYIVITSQSGLTFAVYLDKTGATAAPTGAAYVAVASGRKSRVDISGDTTAAQVAARAELALNALTGFTALITTDDTAADGHMSLTQVTAGSTTNPVPHNANDSGAGSITTAATTPGIGAADKKPVGSGAVRFDVIWRPLSPDGNLA